MIVNLQRDALWTNMVDADRVGWSAETPIVGGTALVNAIPTVFDDVASAQSTLASLSVTANNIRGIGCYIKPPTVDYTPYRIKAHAESADNAKFVIIIGYGPLSPTGSDDIISPCRLLSFKYNADMLVSVPGVEAGGPFDGLPFCVGIGMGAATTQIVSGHVSVQRLASTPPQLAQSTS